MKKNKFFILLLLTGLLMPLAGGETGRIMGRVTDAKTGEPLVGVHVIVEGTGLGAATDATGTYLIFNIPPGSYTVTASYIGYQGVSKEGVRVITDHTTSCDFKLSPTVIEVAPVVVKAEREAVVRTAVQTTRVVSTEEFNRLPVRDLVGLVGLQAGVVTVGGFTHIRGGRHGEVATYVDGINIQDPFFGISYAHPSRDAIQEIVVITGGFDPEYGDAMSGVVHVTTKEGSERRTEGKLRYTTDGIFTSPDLNYGYNFWQTYLSGKFPLIPRSTYFFSGELFKREYLFRSRAQLPSPRQEGSLEGKFTFKGIPKGKLSIAGYLGSTQHNFFAMAWRYWLHRYQSFRMDFKRLNILYNQMIGKAILNLKFGYFYNDRLQTVRDREREEKVTGIWKWLKDAGIWRRYYFKAEDFVLRNDTLPPDSAVIKIWTTGLFEMPWRFETNNPWGVPGLYYGRGDFRIWHYRRSETFTGKADYTLNIGKLHEFKTGVELNYHNLSLYENSLPWSPNPFWDAYDLQPMEFSAYIQDRIDFDALILRGGVRLDLLDANAYYRVYPESLFRRDTAKASIKYQISPRFGMAYPITERIKFRFSYGHFFQNPGFAHLYEALRADIARRGNIIVGNPNLAAEKTVAYETGFEAQVTDYFAFDLTLFYKDIYNLTSTELIPALPMSYYLYKNTAFGRVKGFEITLNKIPIPSHYWRGKLSYTYQEAKGTASTAYTRYYLEYRGIRVPAVDYWLDYDIRHSLNVDFGLSFPENFKVALLRNVEFGTITTFKTGLPYTPTDLRGEQLGDLNSGRRPNVWHTDMRVTKPFKLFRLPVEVFVDIENVFNRENVLSVHSATGSPSYDGWEAVNRPETFPAFGWIGISRYYHPASDRNHDGYVTRRESYDAFREARRRLVDSPLNYGNPILIRVGFGIGF